jgi:hypothetical protein
MTPNTTALALLPLVILALICAASGYLTRYRLPRPPIGVYRWSDIVVMVASVILAPFLYLALPRIIVAIVFGLILTFAIQLTLSVALGVRAATGAALLPVLLTAGAAIAGDSGLVLIGTDVTLFLALVGVANLWVQSGMKAVHVGGLAAALMVYDLCATGLTGVMGRFATEMHDLPFAPVFALTGGPMAVSIGLGDLIMLVLYPLAATRSYGQRAGILAATVGVLAVGAVDAGFGFGLISTGVPFLTVLGPLIVAQQLYWQRRYPQERSVRRWLDRMPVAQVQPQHRSAIADALAIPTTSVEVPGVWLAILDGRIVGRGASPGRARRSAREQGIAAVPVTRQV